MQTANVSAETTFDQSEKVLAWECFLKDPTLRLAAAKARNVDWPLAEGKQLLRLAADKRGSPAQIHHTHADVGDAEKIRARNLQKLKESNQKSGFLSWGRTSVSTLDLHEVIHIDYGIMSRACVLCQRSERERDHPWLFFSIATSKRSFDFVCSNEESVRCWVLSLSRLCPLATGAIRTRAEFLVKTGWCKVAWYCYEHTMTFAQAFLEAMKCTEQMGHKYEQGVADEKYSKIASRKKTGRRSHFVEANSSKTRTSEHHAAGSSSNLTKSSTSTNLAGAHRG